LLSAVVPLIASSEEGEERLILRLTETHLRLRKLNGVECEGRVDKQYHPGSSHSLFPSLTVEFDRITEENFENPGSVYGNMADSYRVPSERSLER
jgi:hypothetical protein